MGDGGGADRQGSGLRGAARRPAGAWIQAVRVRRRLARGFDQYPLLSRRPRVFRELALTVWTAPEGSRTSRIALRAAREAAENPLALRELLAAFCTEALGGAFGRGFAFLRPRPLPPPVTAFLLERVEDARQGPSGRVFSFLAAPELPLPGPASGTHRRLAEWLVHAAMAEDDTELAVGQAFGPLSDPLARTDQPDLLAALSSAFSSGVHDAAHYAGRTDEARAVRPYRLWRDTGPTLLTRVLTANPHLPVLPPPSDGDPPWYTHAPDVLLALLKGRHDLVGPVLRRRGPHGVVSSLSDGLSLPGPSEFTEACRQALRQLEHPVARDDVCRRALYGHEKMRAAAVDAGYLPSVFDEEHRAVFLFATEQWERYDAADPDGRFLTAFCASYPERSLNHDCLNDDWMYALSRGIRSAVLSSGRPDPMPKPPKSAETPSSPTRHHGPVGSWPTSFTNGFGFGTH
ncbi:hypothetical protein FE633_03790 [Streptomyces montanus]|uniref:Uncharacterized protein n=1 Tax=Streptomyces montanus TaxID=2580423 RepID=A0A5R9FUJ8_9ACTN|nr:hypothetical protein [Streptomyces montanus]TLS47617.1 hypothetical protein FE633_03790 [Streptomyces montanus]